MLNWKFLMSSGVEFLCGSMEISLCLKGWRPLPLIKWLKLIIFQLFELTWQLFNYGHKIMTKEVRWGSYLLYNMYLFIWFCHLKHFHILTLKQWSAFYLCAEADSLRQLHMCWGQARTGAAWRHDGDSHQPGHGQAAPLSPEHRREKVGKQKTRENLIWQLRWMLPAC